MLQSAGSMTRPLRIILSPRAALTLTGSHLLLAAASLAFAVLMLLYVRLLHESVDRGAQWRAGAAAAAARVTGRRSDGPPAAVGLQTRYRAPGA